jgi:hypothetical protein
MFLLSKNTYVVQLSSLFLELSITRIFLNNCKTVMEKGFFEGVTRPLLLKVVRFSWGLDPALSMRTNELLK